MATHRPSNLQRQRTPYTRTLFTLTSITTHTPPTPKSKQDADWFKIPSPIPLPPLTSSSDHEDESYDYGAMSRDRTDRSCDQVEPVYAQVLKSCNHRSTDIDHIPSPSETDVCQERRGITGDFSVDQRDGDSPIDRGDSPASYIEAEPTSLHVIRKEDPLWYRQRDSLLLETDPLPYETAVQANTKDIAAKHVSRLCSHSASPLSTPPTPHTSYTPSSLKSPGQCFSPHSHVFQLTSLQHTVHMTDKYHVDGPSSAKESKVFK